MMKQPGLLQEEFIVLIWHIANSNNQVIPNRPPEQQRPNNNARTTTDGTTTDGRCQGFRLD